MKLDEPIVSALSAALCRGIALVFGGVMLCAIILGGVGFALVALFTLLLPTLGAAPAAFATSGVAFAVPVLATLAIMIATRTGSFDGVSHARSKASAAAVMTNHAAHHAQAALRAGQAASSAASAQAAAAAGVDQALGWITKNPRTATLGALSVGVALGAYPDLRKTVLNSVDTALASQRPQ